MPKPRYAQISTGEIPYVHVVSRTVRRSFLCGKDKFQVGTSIIDDSGRKMKCFDLPASSHWMFARILLCLEVGVLISISLELSAYCRFVDTYHTGNLSLSMILLQQCVNLISLLTGKLRIVLHIWPLILAGTNGCNITAACLLIPTG